MKQGRFAGRESMWHSPTISCSDLLMGRNVSIDIYAEKLICEDLLGIAHPIQFTGVYYSGWIVYKLYILKTLLLLLLLLLATT